MKLNIHETLKPVICISILFVSIFWFFYLHIPSLKDGYLDAGDDHVHVAFANETKRIWQGEGRLLGWSRLYGMGAPIFLMRPPGFYVAVSGLHFLTGITIEQSLKLLVLFAFCLFPLSVYISARLLEMDVIPATVSGLLSVLCISMWGHTLDAYQYLGIHKQLLAIFMFPMAVGALWQVLTRGKYGGLFAVLFAAMFMTHPYIAYCYAMNAVVMVVVLFACSPCWNGRLGIKRAILWSIPAGLFLSIWLIPFVSSPEMQLIDPYLSRRYYFEVTGCTTAETLRQYVLGGILDTSFYSGVFGGTQWASGNEWGWIDNSQWPRFPILTLLSGIGWVIAIVHPKNARRCFLGLSFLVSFMLVAGPDDFPILDWIPFAKKFQNIHAIFMFEWAAVMLGGTGFYALWKKIKQIQGVYYRSALIGCFWAVILFGLVTAYYERTMTAKKMVDVRNNYTRNGLLVMKKDMDIQWRTFNQVVKHIQEDKTPGNITGFPQEHKDAMLYNLLPLMVDRSVSLTGFETLGGVYDLMLHHFRADLRNNYVLQKLFNIRFVVNNHFLREVEMKWHPQTEKLYEDGFWELIKVRGDFGQLQALPLRFIGFAGSEREWQDLMMGWLTYVKKKGLEAPWIINVTHAGMKPKDLKQIKPYVAFLLYGNGDNIPKVFEDIPREKLVNMAPSDIEIILLKLEEKISVRNTLEPFAYQVLEKDRNAERYSVKTEVPITSVLFKQSFYRGWEAVLDGNSVPLYRISPGLQMVLVPEGEHTLTYCYTGPNNWKFGKAAFYLGIVVVCLLWVGRWFFIKADPSYATEANAGNVLRRRFGHWGIGAIWVIFFGVVGYQVAAEAYFKKPVIIHPKNGQVMDLQKKTIFWNYVVGIPANAQVFELQIAKDDTFKEIVLSQKIQKNEFRPDLNSQKQEVYFYRLRLVVDGKAYSWTHPERLIFNPGNG